MASCGAPRATAASARAWTTAHSAAASAVVSIAAAVLARLARRLGLRGKSFRRARGQAVLAAQASTATAATPA